MWSLTALILTASAATTRASSPQVTCTSSHPAVLGEGVTLTCTFLAHMDVLQVTWQKKKELRNMVTHSEKYGVKIVPPFTDNISVLKADLANSSIRISSLQKEDEGCYVCHFNVHPNGAFTGEVCLTALDPIKEVNKVTCSAKGRDLDLFFDPPSIQTRLSTRDSGLTEREWPLMLEGQYSDPDMKLRCAFQIPKEVKVKRHSADEEDLVLQCSASGKGNIQITWEYEGEAISWEDKGSKDGKVTSTRHYNMSSLPPSLSCTVSHHPTKPKVWLHLPDGDEGMKAREVSSDSRLWRIPVLVAVLVVVVVMGILGFISRKKGAMGEFSTPKKTNNAKADQETLSIYQTRLKEMGQLTPKYSPTSSCRINVGGTGSSTKKRSQAPKNTDKDIRRSLNL